MSTSVLWIVVILLLKIRWATTSANWRRLEQAMKLLVTRIWINHILSYHENPLLKIPSKNVFTMWLHLLLISLATLLQWNMYKPRRWTKMKPLWQWCPPGVLGGPGSAYVTPPPTPLWVSTTGWAVLNHKEHLCHWSTVVYSSPKLSVYTNMFMYMCLCMSF